MNLPPENEIHIKVPLNQSCTERILMVILRFESNMRHTLDTPYEHLVALSFRSVFHLVSRVLKMPKLVFV